MPRENVTASHIRWLIPFAWTVIACLGIASLARLGYVLWLHDRIPASGGTAFILLQGVRFDLVTLGMLLALPAAATPVALLSARLRPLWLRALRIYLVTIVALFAFMELVTPAFILEYDVRPNYLFVEYLRYPREVFSMLFVGYKLQLALALILVPATAWLFNAGLRRQVANVPRSHALSALPLGLLSLLLCVAAARSTLDHRAVNPSTVAFSSDTLVNSLPLNSLYSAGYAIYETRHEDQGYAYGEVTERAAVAAVRASLGLPDADFVDTRIPTLHHQETSIAGNTPKNLVIVVEESLGAEFVGSLGGLPLTPNIDELSQQGIWFENLYATGTRSARGLEAIVSGFPPTTSQSVLKLGRAQSGFFTIGEYLRRRGYSTSFIYGGEAQFDNMRRFFANNGFETIVDKHNFEDASFTGSWGVADGDVFRHAHELFANSAPDHPFFSVLFTTSNHSPWEFPDGDFELYEEPRATVNNAVRYADHALGQFLRTARASTYWDNTVFLVVADHNSRVYGADLVPIERFHIPGLILGGGITPERWQRVASQIDLLPTVLSLAGASGNIPAPGIDLTRPDIADVPGRAIMQYGNTQAYMEENRVAILRKDMPAQLFSYTNKTYAPIAPDDDLLARAQAYAAWPVIAYRQQEYHLPDESTSLSAAEPAPATPKGGATVQ